METRNMNEQELENVVGGEYRNWAEINYPVQGWIKGAILGYAY